MSGPYPKRKFHKTQESIVVGNAQEEFLAGGGYYDVPIQDVDKVTYGDSVTKPLPAIPEAESSKTSEPQRGRFSRSSNNPTEG